MDMRLYVVYDRVAEQSGPIFEAVNDGVAGRNFKGLMSSVPKVDLDAYDLMSVGSMDKESMKIDTWVPVVVEVNLGGLYLKDGEDGQA